MARPLDPDAYPPLYVQRRYLPLVSDRDRIYAARYQAERLSRRLNDIAYRRKLVWSHYADSNGAVVSVAS